ncbi:DUF2470 domain-containing protein [Blastococcus sp. TML/M2B]|uniref:DUF2470 domain-containing protein n=1 Tax=unclassified Blastococcus TaxID=2619396 RepID=UPI00190A3A81|nr:MULTISPECIES: DUF2470 domain-containing protein [unclassified Blastococcus]MBN1094376.1 DUF2470 domain-containing protein [Blastococcus sp. TML/M2B]MBN1095337.1 DUF2470 domain-containing protein [Blastococcus sp. TML/C7B]
MTAGPRPSRFAAGTPAPVTAPPGAGGQPSPAERARTVAARSAAALHVLGTGTTPALAATTTGDGRTFVVVPTSGPLVRALAGSPVGDLPARLTVTDRAPAALRRPVRALVELAGWLTPVPDRDVAAAVLAFADSCPCEALFEVGLTATLLQLDVADVVLHEAHAVDHVEPEDFAAAAVDPVTAAEADLLTGQAAALARLRARVQAWAGRRDDVALLGLDRFGVRFRVESLRGGYDVRVAFPEPLTSSDGFADAVGGLLCCALD